ncbi:TolC family outer membrane protein [Hydrogenovibrio sp. 3SP14C1]|uniref:TolC family outer membrane protein n=1 Tax=Hydrogenovibrio sp. 3SP14C1 TaxID=3038774 RepID=UPI002417B234|nr:TolC family outer membrane protein [Hydrogenovibrio sp. 3SP14C1]MDG4813223.1 TolC family outer membrane protein [Hydrogenovibrio sp. 3SP14C1]
MELRKKPLLLASLACSALLTFSFNAKAISLKEAVEDAVVHNPEFRQEVKAYQAIEAEIKGAQGGYYPSIDLNAGVGYEEVDRPGIDNTGNGLTRREASVKLTQNLFEGFGTQDEVKRMQYRLDAQAYKTLSKANDIALQMIQAYINLLKQKKLQDLAQTNLETHLKILDQIQRRTEAGIGNQVEVDQAEARLALARSNYGAAENKFYDARAKFQRILGRMPEDNLIQPKTDFTLPKTLEGAINEALINHPTLKSANADIAEAKMQYELSGSNYYPRVDLEVEKTFDNNLSGIEGKNEYLQAMVRFKYNLYNGDRDSASRERTASNFQQATEIRNNTHRQVIENLKYAWNAKLYINNQLDYMRQHIKLTRDTLNGYRKQFSLGRRSLLDLLNTENEYINGLNNLVTSEADQLTAKYRVLNATGHLLSTMGIKYNFIQTDDMP